MTSRNSHVQTSQTVDIGWKPLIVLVAVGAAFALAYFTPVRRTLANIHVIKYWLLSLGWVGPAAWMAIVFGLVAAGMPRLLFCPIGGLAFGFWHGLLWTQVATLAGYYAFFLIVRWGGQDFVLRHWPRVRQIKAHVHGHSAAFLVFAMRQIPISGIIINFCLGLSPVRHHHFLLGTAFGILPQAIPFTLVASGIFKPDARNTPLYVAGAVMGLLLVIASFRYSIRHSRLMAELQREALHTEENSGPSASDED